MLIWVADRPERDAFVPPEGVDVALVPRDPGADPDIERVEVLVPPYRSRRVLDALAAMPALRVVQTLESGVEWIQPHLPPGVILCNSRGVHDAAVAEWVLGAVLAMQRRLPEHFAAQQRRAWRDIVAGGEWREPFAGDLEGSRVLIVGFGSIGAAVERRLEPFDVRIRRVARRAGDGVEPASRLGDLVPEADIVIVLLPLTPQTEGVIDAGLLRSMRPGSLLVNAGRGRLVDQEALTECLYEGRLRAAIDVTDPEPLPESDPLWAAPNLLLTPHMAGDTPRRYRRSWELVGEQVQRLIDGAPLANRM